MNVVQTVALCVVAVTGTAVVLVAEPLRQTLVLAMQKAPAEAGAVVPKLEVETVFEICMGLWSDANLVYVLNFQQARNAEFEKMLASPQQLPA